MVAGDVETLWSGNGLQAPREIRDRLHSALERGMTRALLVGEAAVVDRSPVGATGHFRQSITHDLSGTALDLTGRVFSTDEPVKVAVIEGGRKPGSMPPWREGSALALWTRRVLGGDEQTAFLVARAIARRGLPARRVFAQAFAGARDRMVAAVLDEVRGVGGRR